MTNPLDPTPGGNSPPDHDPEADDVRRMLLDRSRSITPRGTFMDIEQRLDNDAGVRRRNRTMLTAAAAVVLVVLAAGALALVNRDDDGPERVDTLDTTTVVTPTSATAPTTAPTTTTSEDRSTTDPSTVETEPTEPSTDGQGSDTTVPGRPEVVAISSQTPVRIDGIGPISVPMAVTDAAAATGQPIAIDPDSIIEESNACRFAQDPSLPGIWYMVDRDRIVRVDVTGQGSPNLTDAGVGVGSTKAEVLAAYPGRVTEEPHPYAMDENSRNLVVTDPAHPGMSITFSVHQGAVVDYRAGLADWVAMPEGCA